MSNIAKTFEFFFFEILFCFQSQITIMTIFSLKTHSFTPGAHLLVYSLHYKGLPPWCL